MRKNMCMNIPKKQKENGNPVANAKVYIEGSDVKETVTIIESKCEVEFEKEHKNVSFIITI